MRFVHGRFRVPPDAVKMLPAVWQDSALFYEILLHFYLLNGISGGVSLVAEATTWSVASFRMGTNVQHFTTIRKKNFVQLINIFVINIFAINIQTDSNWIESRRDLVGLDSQLPRGPLQLLRW